MSSRIRAETRSASSRTRGPAWSPRPSEDPAVDAERRPEGDGRPSECDLVRRLYEPFDRKDVPTISALISKDALWHVPGSTLISGEHRGHQAIFEYFGRMGELSGRTLHAELVDVLASEAHAVAVASGRRADRTDQGRYLLLMRIRDRQIVEARLFNEDRTAFQSFWS